MAFALLPASSCVWVCNNEENSQLGYFWFRRQYHMVPHTYKKNMRAVCLVHPSASVRLLVFFLSYICKTSFWDKVKKSQHPFFPICCDPISPICHKNNVLFQTS